MKLPTNVMKKLLFTFALLINTVLAFATNGQTIARATADNVKMYRQAGTSSEIVKSLSRTDNLVIIRQHNANWTLVSLNDKVGYVVTSELKAHKNLNNLKPQQVLTNISGSF